MTWIWRGLISQEYEEVEQWTLTTMTFDMGEIGATGPCKLHMKKLDLCKECTG